MPALVPLLAAYLLCAGLALAFLAVVLYRQDRHNLELRGSAWLLVSLGGAALLAAAFLAWMELGVASTRRGRAPAPVQAEHVPEASGMR